MDFLGTINALGTVPLLVLITVIFILLVREVKKDGDHLRSALEAHRKEVDRALAEYKAGVERQVEAQNKAIAEYKVSVDRHIEVQNKQLEKLEERLRLVETEYAEKTYVQEINSGWRTEIRRIDDKLDRVLMGDKKQ